MNLILLDGKGGVDSFSPTAALLRFKYATVSIATTHSQEPVQWTLADVAMFSGKEMFIHS